MNSSLPILEQGYVTPDASSTRSSGQQPMDQTPQTPSKLPDKDIERNSIYSNDVPWEAHPERLADVRRGLKQRHIHMFALAGTIGKFLWKHARPCKALAEAGPLGAFLGYTVRVSGHRDLSESLLMKRPWSSVAYTASEMSAFSPVSGGFVRHTTKFVDPVLGAVTGWNFWYSMAITAVVELVATCILVSYWAPQVHIAILRVYGEVEFGFALLKITLIVVLLLVGLVITAGGGPTHESIGFRYWRDPGPFRQLALSEGQTIGGRQQDLLSGCTVLHFVGIHDRPPAPSTEPLLLGGDGTAAQSPFVIAMHRARIRVLPDIVNAVVLSSAFSSGVSCIFIASRSLIGLAEDGNAPVIFSRTNRLGNPWVAVMCSSAFGALGYLSVTEKSMKVLLWLINLSAVAGLVSWIILCIGYLRFYAAIKAQGYTRDDLPYRAPFQPFTAWFALVMVILITFFSGFRVFLTGQFSVADFLSNYVNIFVFLGLYITWKLYTRDRQIYRPATKVDLSEFEAIRQEREQNLTTLPTLIYMNISGLPKLGLFDRVFI
ncbi:Amino acid permease [Rhizoctonia solani]|uniref:Amino acid permease n=1 Tax=Rhizoctonia solani TaxID=456999 RepID=A0A8H7M5K3_9AGAM|nr:Amino acid permease [Rhizoctonia solani]